MDLADEAGVHIPRSCCAGTCAVCEVKITRGGRERTVRACTATPRDEDVVDVSSGDAELARMMARFEGQDGLDYSRVAPAAPSRPARPPPPPVYEDAWREPEPVVFADDDYHLGGGGASAWNSDHVAKNHQQGPARVGVHAAPEASRAARVGRTR